MDINSDWLSEVRFNSDGLIPVIAQDDDNNRILMQAWMSRESLEETVRTGRAVYWSRSRQKRWHKGESSGHEQLVREVQLDCDGDVLILRVEQVGEIACHTGRNSCFFRKLTEDGWQDSEPVLKDPREIYPGE
ncbi:MAG: phosphoribosyl-AMP cyclohydrolase [Gammaproteobacteria bacterium]|nr:phosphoribosyl-AMP cyclohydrolase [Gammaproteobacteria bacterium]MBT4493455.1 phosphoribosyl-AMP cyclohydrolase [Gammaproteobacteria bacterium]MBT7372331.1 phosphoribosyl-AMP cyclohydrolase [Gammaproteobacteria bacterium]